MLKNNRHDRTKHKCPGAGAATCLEDVDRTRKAPGRQLHLYIHFLRYCSSKKVMQSDRDFQLSTTFADIGANEQSLEKTSAANSESKKWQTRAVPRPNTPLFRTLVRSL